jgi:hypothetical protein
MTDHTAHKTSKARTSEKGNVLFLILIAVALFAALSYAVTQSSRSGSGDAGSETNLVNSAQITQYPSSVRTSIIRMMVSKGVAVDQLLFDKPPYTDLTSAALRERGVFHPEGGGASYGDAAADVMVSGAPGVWYFNGALEVANLGTTAAGVGGNEIIAFLPGIKRSVCEKLNEQLGITGDVNSDVDISGLADNMITASTANVDGVLILGDATSTDTVGLAGQAFGCYRNNNTDNYVYYHVLVEQ